MGPLLIAVVAALAVACGDNGDPTPFSIQLRLGDGVGDHCAPNLACADYGMACGAKLGIRIVDAESIFEASLAPDASPGSDAGSSLDVVVNRCIDVPDSDNLCSLDDAVVSFPDIPARMMRIQVAMWSPEALAGQPCPTDVFDLGGQPLLVSPQPAFGGAVYFDVGSDDVATVSLSCNDPGQLNSLACQPDKTSVNAYIDDVTTNVDVQPEQAVNLAVSAGEPRARTTEEEETEWVLEPIDTHDLTLIGALPTPYWTGDEIPSFNSAACVLTLDRLPAQAVTSVACQRVEDLDITPGGPTSLKGLLLPDPILDAILLAANLGETFPEQGLVVGRVVSDVGAPMANVEVKTSDSDASVEYVSNGWLGTNQIATGTNGYFLSRDAEWNSLWTAQDTVCDQVQDGTYLAGLLVGKVTVLVIRMTDDPECF